MKKIHDKMKNHHPIHLRTHRRRVGETLVGKPNDLIRLFMSDTEEYEWMIDKIINEGPPSKQIRAAIILRKISELVDFISMQTGEKPSFIEGVEVESDLPEDDDYTYPINLINEVHVEIQDERLIADYFGEGPAHDVLKDILLIDAICWLKSTIENKLKLNDHEDKN